MDGAGLPDDLSSELSPGFGEEGIVVRFVGEHRGEVRPRGVSADEEALREVRFEEGRVLDDLEYARYGEELVRDEVSVGLPI